MEQAAGKIYVILTGGTIDSITKGLERDVLLEHSAVPEYLQSLKLHQEFEFSQACMKDSRDITENDRKKILQLIEQADLNKIIVTHGTYTMIETAKYLKLNLKRKGLAVILTGAIVPLKFENSDAPVNLKFALEQAGILPAEVYVCMNGQIFSSEEAVKDEKTGQFYSKIKVK